MRKGRSLSISGGLDRIAGSNPVKPHPDAVNAQADALNREGVSRKGAPLVINPCRRSAPAAASIKDWVKMRTAQPERLSP